MSDDVAQCLPGKILRRFLRSTRSCRKLSGGDPSLLLVSVCLHIGRSWAIDIISCRISPPRYPGCCLGTLFIIYPLKKNPAESGDIAARSMHSCGCNCHRVSLVINQSSFIYVELLSYAWLLRAISQDPVAHPNPDKFDPQRWIGGQGQFRNDMEGSFPYGFGRR